MFVLFTKSNNSSGDYDSTGRDSALRDSTGRDSALRDSNTLRDSNAPDSATRASKPSLLERMDPRKDADGDGKK